MTTKTMDIANELVSLCREGRNAEALDKLFASDVVSVEAGAPPGMQRECRGLPEVRAKNAWWTSNHEIHASTVTGPWPHDDRFVVGFAYDITNKPSGRRMKMEEVGLYTVKDGKIVREEFFYSMGS